MKLDEFSVDIIGNTSTRGGYVMMEHNTQYQLLLINYCNHKCDAAIEIDGGLIGTKPGSTKPGSGLSLCITYIVQ
ncbi:hypothetical protein [Endozoicomonas sp.]|uniref:hypothetical protein n=1 Tax=Endozoicomonas sp. TaxID=1892382 RepID=UPI00383A195E